MMEKVGRLYDIMANGIVEVDSLLKFFFDLYGHVDAGFRELIRGKLSSLFNAQARSSLLGKDLSRAEKEQLDKGSHYFGGDQAVRDRFESLKKEEIINRYVNRRARGSGSGSSRSRNNNDKSKGSLCLILSGFVYFLFLFRETGLQVSLASSLPQG